MLIDSHCHLPSSHDEAAKIINAASLEGVTHEIVIGTSIKEDQKVIKLAAQFPNLFCTIAVYPHEGKESNLLDLEKALRHFLDKKKTKIVGIGECGIDVSNWHGGRPLDEQKPLFEMQVKLALDYKLPLVIHNRNGDEHVLDILDKYKSQDLTGVFHCFASSWEYAQKVLDLGFYLSFSGMITYPSRKALLEVVKNVPANRYLVETDSPYLPPQGFRGQPNEPKYVKIVAQKVAEVRGELLDTVAHTTFSNTSDLFKLNI